MELASRKARAPCPGGAEHTSDLIEEKIRGAHRARRQTYDTSGREVREEQADERRACLASSGTYTVQLSAVLTVRRTDGQTTVRER